MSKNNDTYVVSAVIFWHNPTAPWCACLILQGFYNCHGRNWLLNYSCCRIGDLASVVSLVQKNNSPLGKVSAICWIFLVSRLQRIFVLVVCCMGITVLKDHTLWQMFMPLPANSLMQSAGHVTVYVCMTPAAQVTDDTAFKHAGTLYILWLSMEMGVSTALKLILSKMEKPCLTMSPWILRTHLLFL